MKQESSPSNTTFSPFQTANNLLRSTSTQRSTSSTFQPGVSNTTSPTSRLPPRLKSKTPSDGFKNLEELLLVTRKPDKLGCGCCHEFDGPEKGVPEFAELEDGAMNKGSKKYFEKGVEECERVFAKIKLENPEWRAPKARFVRLKRDGVIV
jgi:hypothetical protein